MPKAQPQASNQSQQASSDQTTAPTLTAEEIKKIQILLIQSNQQNQEKDREIKRLQEEQVELIRKINEKSENKGDYETHFASAKRRLAIHPVTDRNTKHILRIVQTIVNDAQKYIPQDFAETITNMRGKSIPTGVRQICLHYNVESCQYNFTHYSSNENVIKLHFCILCAKMFDVGMCHQAQSCPCLLMIDRIIEENK